jgi:hypothetical protein
VMLNGGDELALSFNAAQLPAKQPGYARDFLLYVVGWDKDADFHVAEGSRIEPLPFIGMHSQHYSEPPLTRENSSWTTKYNTRWVGSLVMQKKAQ